MKTIVRRLVVVGALAVVTLGAVAQVQQSASRSIPATGVIYLRILNSACAAVSPETAEGLHPNPEGLNDRELDSTEEAALAELCTLQATAIAPNGMRLTDIPLALLRADRASGEAELFEGTRNSDDYGTATWRFRLTPNTHFFFQVVSPNPVKRSVWSNVVEIQMCTGVESSARFPEDLIADAGRGCQ